MISGNLREWKQMKGLEGLEPAFRFLEDNRTLELPAGQHSIDGDRVYAVIIRATSRDPELSEFESHRKYIDVQYLVSGLEMIGISSLDRLSLSQPYQDDIDAAMYSVPPTYFKLEMRPGHFAVFFPEDGHMPNCHLNGPHELHKVVVKVTVERHR